MKTLMKQATTLAVVTLAACGVASANDHDTDDQCSEATLHGLYVFNASGFNVVGGVAQPKAIVELIRFHGDGTLAVPAATRSINGVISRPPRDGGGTYTLTPDCTGSLQFGPPGPTFDIFVAPEDGQIHMIQTGPTTPGLPVLQGIVQRLSP